MAIWGEQPSSQREDQVQRPYRESLSGIREGRAVKMRSTIEECSMMSAVEITPFIIFTTKIYLIFMLVSNFALGNPSTWKLSLLFSSLEEVSFLQLVIACSVYLYQNCLRAQCFACDSVRVCWVTCLLHRKAVNICWLNSLKGEGQQLKITIFGL